MEMIEQPLDATSPSAATFRARAEAEKSTRSATVMDNKRASSVRHQGGVTGLCLASCTIADAEFLFRLRNDPETVAGSSSGRPVTWTEHVDWLEGALANPGRHLYVAYRNGVAVGSVRADWRADRNVYELSWTVAPEARGQGIGSRMVALLGDRISEAIMAVVFPSNAASRRICAAAGMPFIREEDGLLVHGRSAASSATTRFPSTIA